MSFYTLLLSRWRTIFSMEFFTFVHSFSTYSLIYETSFYSKFSITLKRTLNDYHLNLKELVDYRLGYCSLMARKILLEDDGERAWIQCLSVYVLQKLHLCYFLNFWALCYIFRTLKIKGKWGQKQAKKITKFTFISLQRYCNCPHNIITEFEDATSPKLNVKTPEGAE